MWERECGRERVRVGEGVSVGESECWRVSVGERECGREGVCGKERVSVGERK